MTQLFEKPMEVVGGLRPSDVIQSIARTASSFAESATSFAESATTLASELVHVKTKDELAQGELQQEIALARQHRDLSVRAEQLAQAVKQKRAELEESLLRIEEIEQAVAAREIILANPVVRRPPPDPLAESRRRAAAQQLYQAFAGEGVSAAREDAYSESLASLADDDAAYDEDVYAYDDDAPSRAGSKAPMSEPTDADRALEGLRAMLPSPRTAAAAYAAAQPPAAAGPSRSASQVPDEDMYGEAPQRTMTAGSLGPASNAGADSRTATMVSDGPGRKPSGRGSSVGSVASMPEPARAGSRAGADVATRAASSAAALAGGAPPLPSGGGILGDMLGGDSRQPSRAPTQEISRTMSGAGAGPAGTDPAAMPSKAASMGEPGSTSLQADVAKRSATVATVGGVAAMRAPSADAAAMARVGEEAEQPGYEYYSEEEDAAAETSPSVGGGGDLTELYQQAHEETEEQAVAVPGAGLSVLVGGSESGDGGSVGGSLVTPGGDAGEEGYEYYSDEEGGDDLSPELSRAPTAQSGAGAGAGRAPSVAAPAAAADGRTASAMTTGSAGSYYYDEAEAAAVEEAPKRTMTASSFTAQEAVAKALAAGDAAASSTAVSQQAEAAAEAEAAAAAAEAEEAEATEGVAEGEEGGEEGVPAGEDQYAYEYAYEYGSEEVEAGAPATSSTLAAAAPAAAPAAAQGEQGEVARYLASRMSVDAYQRREETAVTQRLFAMQRGGVLYKYNQGKGMFGNKSEGTRINPRWAQLNQAQTELQWGDLKTRKLNSSLRLADVSKIEFGHASDVFKSFTFKPHDAWLCFSLHSAGRTIDFAAAKESELANWFCGLSGLLKGKPGGGMSHGALMWRILQVKMGEELASQGFGGKIKAYAKKITREKALASSPGGEQGGGSGDEGPRGVSFVDNT